MLSQAQICNLALLQVGGGTVTSIDDNTTEALSCKALWDAVRDLLLYRHPWNFAMARADLGSALAATPAFEYDYQYTLPSGCLRVWEFYGKPRTTPWVVEGGVFLTDEAEEIYIRYISQVTDVEKFSLWFAECLALALAAELAVKLGKGEGRKKELLAELEAKLLYAFSIDSQEGNGAKTPSEKELAEGEYSWTKEGR